MVGGEELQLGGEGDQVAPHELEDPLGGPGEDHLTLEGDMGDMDGSGEVQRALGHQAALLDEASEVLGGAKGLKLSSFHGGGGPGGGQEMPLGPGALPLETQHYYEGLQPAPIMVYEVPAGNIVPFDSLVPVPLAKGMGGVKEGEGAVDLLQGGVGEGVYAPAPQDVAPPLYVLHQPHKKDGAAGLDQPGDGLVLGGREGGEGAFPRVGGDGAAMMPIGAEFSLISSSCYETNMAQLSMAYHGSSDTDSEVALTLASLGTPKLERTTLAAGNGGLGQAFQELEPQQPPPVAKKADCPPPPPPPQRPTLVLRSRRSRAANTHHTSTTTTATTTTTAATTTCSVTTTSATSTTASTTTTSRRRRSKRDNKAAAASMAATTSTTTTTTSGGGVGLEESGGGSGGSFVIPDGILAVRGEPSPVEGVGAVNGSTGSTTNTLQQQEAQKENLLGQLLKASEQCEPASLIPAGVVDDVIPAVGYRIMDMTNLGEMVRMMHRCPGLGTIVIQEQASLREGAVSQLSVICTSCQEGAVCATSNRAAAAGPWDINARVEQLTREFSIKEDQLQRMLEILGIFYRPCDPALQPVTQPMELEMTPAQNSPKKKRKKKSETSPSGKPKNLVCTVCKQRFVGVNHLKKHMHSHDLNLHTCPYCHAYFKKPFNLKEHIKKHQNCKYECSHCQREFTDKSTLLCHVRSQHEKRYKIECELCQKRFYHRAHYNEHMRIHTGEKPYMCELCGKKFSWHDSVKKHMQTHSAESKYKCRLCGKWFRWLQGVRQHLQYLHKLKKCDIEAQVVTAATETASSALPQFHQHQTQQQQQSTPQQQQQHQQHQQQQQQQQPQVLAQEDSSSAPREYHTLEAAAPNGDTSAQQTLDMFQVTEVEAQQQDMFQYH